MIVPVSALGREEEGLLLRALIGMLVKKRTADADMLEFSRVAVRDFIHRYTVGVTKDEIAGVLVVTVQRRADDGEKLEVMS